MYPRFLFVFFTVFSSEYTPGRKKQNIYFSSFRLKRKILMKGHY